MSAKTLSASSSLRQCKTTTWSTMFIISTASQLIKVSLLKTIRWQGNTIRLPSYRNTDSSFLRENLSAIYRDASAYLCGLTEFTPAVICVGVYKSFGIGQKYITKDIRFQLVCSLSGSFESYDFSICRVSLGMSKICYYWHSNLARVCRA